MIVSLILSQKTLMY